MKTKLYRMWIKHCMKNTYAMYNQVWLQRDSKSRFHIYSGDKPPQNAKLYGCIPFNNSFSGERVKFRSSKYQAWNAFKHARVGDSLVDFLIAHWKTFKNSFPFALVVLDLHNANIKSIKHDIDLKKAVFEAMASDIDNRKKSIE